MTNPIAEAVQALNAIDWTDPYGAQRGVEKAITTLQSAPVASGTMNREAKSLGFLVHQWAYEFKIILGPHSEAGLADIMAKAGYGQLPQAQQVPSVEELTRLYLKTGTENRKLINEALAKKQAQAVHDLLTARQGVNNDR